VTGGFSGDSWEKLYDVVDRRGVVVFESAVASGSQWPDTPEPFGFTVGGQRVEARPTNLRKVPTPDGRQATHADLGVRMPINQSASGPLKLAVRFGGYRASWAIWQPNLKPGAYVQSMATPRTLPVAGRESDRTKVGDRDTIKAMLPIRTPRRRSCPASLSTIASNLPTES
jgi:hypothetical protein